MALFKRDFENTRTNWASLDWNEAQKQLASLLSAHEFMRFEEARLSKSSRADIIVIRQTTNEIIFGVIEVKTYRKISPSIKEKAIKQVCRYLNAFYSQTYENSKYGKKLKRYFATVVFTHDYPSSMESKVGEKQLTHLYPEIIEKGVELFVCRPENLITQLLNRNLVALKQQSLDDYY